MGFTCGMVAKSAARNTTMDRRRTADSVACPKTELERLTERVGYEMK